MLRLLRGLARGSVAWVAGYLVTMLLLIADLAGAGSKPLRDAGPLYLEAHALGVSVDPRYVVAVPVVVLAIVGYQTGASLRKGLTGRLRSVARSVRGTDRGRLRRAATAAGWLAVGYAIVSTVAALLVGGPVDAAVGAFVYALVVGTPAPAVGATDVSEYL